MKKKNIPYGADYRKKGMYKEQIQTNIQKLKQ